MKRVVVLVLLVPILTIAMISCDADIRSDIAGLMGGFGGNVYIDNEWVQPNKADAEAAVTAIASLGTAGSTATTSNTAAETVFGINGVDLSGLTSGATILAPQSVDDQNALKNSVASALTSPTQTATLIVELSKPATAEQKTAAAGTTAVFNAVITSLAAQVTTDNPTLGAAIAELSLPDFSATDDITQGDILILQMMTNLVNNTITQLSDGSGGIDAATVDSDTALAILGDALFTAQVAEQLSGASTINFSGDLITGLTGLMDDSGDKSSRNGGDDTVPLDDLKDSIGVKVVNTLMPQIVGMFGIQKSEDTFTYTAEQYKKFLLNQRAYLASMNHAIAFYEAGNISNFEDDRMDVGTLIKYLIAFMVTTFDDFYDAESTTPSLTKPETFLAFVNANKAMASGTLDETTPGTMTIPGDFKKIFTAMGTYLSSKQTNDQILTNLANRAKTLVEMTGFENADLDKMLDDLPTTIDEWFEE
ncbi:hypothetical protein [Sphaerochaeta globosa]|uniref:DUF4856 domain-containing protein n=1 Tax=Sphaerochaeta globosa (strain ATCC BAA-1886 / DSM 22777 / Buddy) TaxID=158189 RepID=F0RYC4_SPHGB|nr:hypothetical protein [Sphaerochaeta globosa]ADY12695.1 hypothetical protein SpiBuddy_0868 [Sphaerochaeta globosa str. Buddy]